MRILMSGRGTIATIYGWALAAAGHDVEFYVRPGRATLDEVELDLVDARRNPLGRRIREPFRTALRDSVGPDDGFDLVVLSVGHHRLAEAAAFLAPRIGAATVLVFGNVWEEPLAAVAPLPADQVVFGFPGAGGGVDDRGVLHGALLGSVVLGTAGSSPAPRELAVRGAFRQAGLAVREEKDMRGWLWVHVAADAGMFAQALRSGGMPNMIGNRRALRDAFLTARELLPVLQARGVDLRRHRGVLLPFRAPRLVGAAVALASALVPIGRISLAMHPDPHAAEPRAVLEDTRREARRLGIPLPRLEAAMAGAAG